MKLFINMVAKNTLKIVKMTIIYYLEALLKNAVFASIFYENKNYKTAQEICDIIKKILPDLIFELKNSLNNIIGICDICLE